MWGGVDEGQGPLMTPGPVVGGDPTLMGGTNTAGIWNVRFVAFFRFSPIVFSNRPALGTCHHVAPFRQTPLTRSNHHESRGIHQIRRHQHHHNGLARGHRKALHHRSLISRRLHGKQVRTRIKADSHFSRRPPRHAAAESIRQTDGCIRRRQQWKAADASGYSEKRCMHYNTHCRVQGAVIMDVIRSRRSGHNNSRL